MKDEEGEEIEEQLEEFAEDDSEELTEEEAEFLGETDEGGNHLHLVGDDPDSVLIPSGRSLFLKEIISQTSKRRHRIVLLAGAYNSGKTSLASDIYISFQNDEFQDISFSGSQTLVGFEEKCWTARTQSMRTFPQTPRTGVSDPKYLHLRIKDEKDGNYIDLLLCDIAGETFERASNSEQGCLEIEDVDWIDHFVLIIDGEKLTDLVERNSAFNQSKQLLFRLLDTKKLRSNSLIQIVFSKSDIIDMSEPSNLDFIETIKEDFTQKLHQRNINPKFFYTAAHNIYGDINKPFEIKELLRFWLRNSPKIDSKIDEVEVSQGQREIDKFYKRELNFTSN